MGESKRESVRAAHSKVREREGEPHFFLEGGEAHVDFAFWGCGLRASAHGAWPLWPLHACVVSFLMCKLPMLEHSHGFRSCSRSD